MVSKINTFPSASELELREALALDRDGVPKLFSMAPRSIINVLEAANGKLDPLKIVDPISGRNIFIHLANAKDSRIGDQFLRLVRLYPQSFQKVGQDLISVLLSKRPFTNRRILAFEELYVKNGGLLDPFVSLWCQIARRVEPDEKFWKIFSSFSSHQKQILYNAAFQFNNPYLSQPAEISIRPSQFTINLMWINKCEIDERQEFLMDSASFHEKFVSPICKWAKANPGTSINIWVDREMDKHGAIDRSINAVLKQLDKAACEHIHFRDIRTLEVVRENPKIFSEDTFIFFRVDLLKAAAADQSLRSKETEFFVFADLDIEPTTSKNLFDKRTLTYLHDFGFVMAKGCGGKEGYENSFQIFNGNHHHLLASHRKIVIDLNLEQFHRSPHTIREQQIFHSYRHLLEAALPSDQEEHTMPVKPVQVPPSHFCGD